MHQHLERTLAARPLHPVDFQPLEGRELPEGDLALGDEGGGCNEAPGNLARIVCTGFGLQWS